MKLFETFTNEKFTKSWPLDRRMQFNVSLPKILLEEITTLSLVHDSLVMRPEQRTPIEFASIFKIDPTISRVEYTLNKRHFSDYLELDQSELVSVVDLFGTLAMHIRCKANSIGIEDNLTFVFSQSEFPTFNNEDTKDPLFTFYRHRNGGHIFDLTNLDEFEHDLLLVVII